MEQTPETMRLALGAIASMDTDTQAPHELLVLAVTIAKIELEKDFDMAKFELSNAAMICRVQRAAIPTPAYVWAVENETRLSPEYIEQEAQNKADYLESVLLADGETTPGQRTACTIAVTFFETCGVLTDADVYGSDRTGLVEKCKQFAYGEK